MGLIWLTRVLAFTRLDDVHLTPPRWKRACISVAGAKQQQLGGVSEIKADTSAIWSTILADLVPDQVGFVGKPPGAEHG
jgi:hypothetical protein